MGPESDGSGHHPFLHEHGEYKHAINTTCAHCNGTGEIPETECAHCHGTGLIQETVDLVVQVPAGAPPGHKITLPGDGNQARGYQNGDLVFIVALVPHPRFQVQGDDLVYNAQISLVEALIGFSKRLTLPLGDRIVVEHDGVTSNSYKKVYEGHGLPKLGSTERGNLVVEFDVQFPTRLSKAQRKALAVVMDEEELV